MPTSQGRPLLAIACALISSVSLTACVSLTDIFGQTRPQIDVNAVACAAFKPITWSPRDTDETLRQIREHNAALEALCGEDSP